MPNRAARAGAGPRPRRLERLAWLLSWRTISGKLIIGLLVLFGLAGIAIRVVTDDTVNQSLMVSLNQQLQSATQIWSSCVNSASDEPPGSSPHSSGPGDGYRGCSGNEQEPGTLVLLLKGDSVTYKEIVPKECRLSAADTATLAALKAAFIPQPSGSSDPPRALVPPPPPHEVTLPSLGGTYLLTKVSGLEPGTTIVTGLPVSLVDTTLADVEDKENLVFGVILVAALVLGTVMVQFSLRPLHRVAATATRVTQLPLDSGEVTLPAGVPDNDPRTEAGRVGAAFNRMLFHVQQALGRRAASEARLRRFAADASHELRTPLSAIRGYAELALRHPGPVPPEVTHALTRVQAESQRMGVLVDDLLLLARLDAGRPLERTPVDLSRLAIETTSDAQVARGDHRWRLDLPDEPVLVNGDEHRLHQVLANLLSNAGKHTPPGSTVSVALTADPLGSPVPGSPAGAAPGDGATVQRGVPPAGARAELSITDVGPGIPPELLPELFERFTRADTSRARDASAAGKSTGLGLAIVDAVVAAHDGCITVTSRPGLTRFVITLPLRHEPADQPHAPAF